jgi:hypothetical protein
MGPGVWEQEKQALAYDLNEEGITSGMLPA